jgi:outer membrane protein OmpA-like peptidoglycan-associated protein
MNRLLLLAIFVMAIALPKSQAQTDENGKSYFVVIGAFAYEKNAIDFVENWCKKFGLNTQYKMNGNRKLFYVYTLQDKHWGIPVQEAERIRKLNAKFDQTWVFYGTLDDLLKQEVTQATQLTQPTLEVIQINPPETDNSTAPAEQNTETSATQNNESSGEQNETPAEVDDTKRFIFKLQAEDGTELKAPIELVDLDKSSLAALYPSNEVASLKPINESGRVMVQSKVFGYRLKQVGINFNNPTDSASITQADGVYTVPMTLKQLVVGDVTIMYNVFFYKDAAIMRPDSKYEVNALVAMMQQFPNRKIIIHGHTNGNYRGKIITMDERKDFFSMSGTDSKMGSATQLSEERAKCIAEYLVANGIDRSRMEIKPWGGKKMLYDHDHKRAIENVRVEVEIVKD